jgi:hypothetical protein
MHVGHEQVINIFISLFFIFIIYSFLLDETQKQLFEQVLTRMHMSPEEELYIRRIVKNTDHGLEKLLTSKFTTSINISNSFLFHRINT